MVALGGCHCGNVSYGLCWPVESPGIPQRACNCTYCVMTGALWTGHPDASLEVSLTSLSALRQYRFSTKTADFNVCSSCGVLVFASAESPGHMLAVVNTRTLNSATTFLLPPVPIDLSKETLEERLERRSRVWIPRVMVSVVGLRG